MALFSKDKVKIQHRLMDILETGAMRRQRWRNRLANIAVVVMAFYIILQHTPIVRNDDARNVMDRVEVEAVRRSEESLFDDVEPVEKKKVTLPEVTKTEVKVIKRNIPYTRPRNPEKARGIWHVVKADDPTENGYIYSAYLDERETIEQTTIRVLGVFEDIHDKIHCLLWYRGRGQPTLIAAKYIWSPHIQWDSDKKFEGSVLSCGVPEGAKPSHVSLIISPDEQPTNLIEIQTPLKDANVVPFGLCVTQVYSNRTLDMFKFIEWMEGLKLLGVKEVTMYYETIPSSVDFLIKSYASVDRFLVLHLVPDIAEQDEAEERIMNGFPLVNDCIYRNMFRYERAIIADLDEMIIPKSTENYKDLFEDIYFQSPTDHPMPIYFFKTAYFFSNLPSKSDPKYSVSLRFSYRAPLQKSYMFGASVVHPRSIVALIHPAEYVMAPHYATTGWNVSVSPEIALNHRYEKCELDQLDFQEDLCEKSKKVIYLERPFETFSENLEAAMTAVFFKHNMESDIFYGGEAMETDLLSNDYNMTELLKDPSIASIVQKEQLLKGGLDNAAILKDINMPAPKDLPPSSAENKNVPGKLKMSDIKQIVRPHREQVPKAGNNVEIKQAMQKVTTMKS